jgi:hypothetical protein
MNQTTTQTPYNVTVDTNGNTNYLNDYISNNNNTTTYNQNIYVTNDNNTNENNYYITNDSKKGEHNYFVTNDNNMKNQNTYLTNDNNANELNYYTTNDSNTNEHNTYVNTGNNGNSNTDNYNSYLNNNNILDNIGNSNTEYLLGNNTTNENINANPSNNNVSQPKQTIIPEQKEYFRPQTAYYFNETPNMNENYTENIQAQSNTYPSDFFTTDNLDQKYQCYICGEIMPKSAKNDHLLCHQIEQEDQDSLQARRLQDEDLYNNISPEQIEEQRTIEEQIRRQRQNNNNTTNNNNNNNNNLIPNNLNLGNDMLNLGNMAGMNLNGLPNVIMRRRITNNNGQNIIEDLGSGMDNPGFFNNFFNGRGMMNMAMPGGNNGGRLIIPMNLIGNRRGGGNMMNQNELNELIDRMLHHTRENPTDTAIVSELPETKIDDIKKLDNDKKNCVICMEDFKNGDTTTNLPCLHMFHTNCIQSWLKKQNTCPICKFKLTPENINNINRRN